MKRTIRKKAQDEAFMLAAKVQLYDFFAATVDIFGDMPFFKACTLPLTNDVNGSYAPYDKAEDIYKTILDELKDIAPRFRSATVPKNFSTQDFINLGDMEKWERYANSLRLRLAMRVATQGALQAEGRAVIKEILENPADYPLVEEQGNNIFIVNQKSGQLNFTAGHGLGDWVTNRLASGAIIDRMLGHGNYDMTSSDPLSGVYVKGEDDPRILLNYNPVSITNRETGQMDEHRYLGTDLTVADELTEYYSAQAQDEVNTANKGFSQITQRGFFWENDKFDMLIIFARDTFPESGSLCHGVRCGTGYGKGGKGIQDAVSQSIALYYYYDSIGSGENCRRYDAPTDKEIADFANARWNSTAYVDKLDASSRRNGCTSVSLSAARHGVTSAAQAILRDWCSRKCRVLSNVPNRWRYPSTEVNYNPYYKDVAGTDTYTEKLFWAK